MGESLAMMYLEGSNLELLRYLKVQGPNFFLASITFCLHLYLLLFRRMCACVYVYTWDVSRITLADQISPEVGSQLEALHGGSQCPFDLIDFSERMRMIVLGFKSSFLPWLFRECDLKPPCRKFVRCPMQFSRKLQASPRLRENIGFQYTNLPLNVVFNIQGHIHL